MTFPSVDTIRTRLGVIVGEPMRNYGRAADMQMFDFGLRSDRVGKRRTLQCGNFLLHLQCPWRICRSGGLLVGSADMLETADESDQTGGALRNHLLASTFPDSGLVVTGLDVGEAGAYSLVLEKQHSLDVMPNALVGESWRFFDRRVDNDDLVVASSA